MSTKNVDPRLLRMDEVCSDKGEQAIRVVSGGMSDEQYKQNGGTVCPFCKAPDAGYHEDFFLKDIPIEKEFELHASLCDGCGEAWYDVVETETGTMFGTRVKDFNGVQLARKEKEKAEG